MIYENVQNFISRLPKTNPFGEKVTLVAAVKTQTPDAINEAIRAGVRDIGDNHVQEFRDKYDAIEGEPNRHFIGHLQLNKVKYLIGKTYLYQSVDRIELAEEISRRSERAGVNSDVLLQINAGNEQSKGGFTFEEFFESYEKIAALPALTVKGIMAMLPFSDDESLLRPLAERVRKTYDGLLTREQNCKYLSMGMSGDWKLCVECGSNMIRIGTTLFGARHYD